MNIIKCCKCRKEKKSSEYALFHGKLNKTCKECRSYHNKWYKENHEGYRDKRKIYYEEHKNEHRKRMYRNHIRRKYGLSIEQLTEMLSLQKNRCKICERDFDSLTKWNSACVDHDHKTGKIRGILCRKCNLTLAYIEDFSLWESAQNYLGFNGIRDKELL